MKTASKALELAQRLEVERMKLVLSGKILLRPEEPQVQPKQLNPSGEVPKRTFRGKRILSLDEFSKTAFPYPPETIWDDE